MKSEKNRERPNFGVGFCRYFLVSLAALTFAAMPTMAMAAEEVEGIAKLGINIPGLIAQLVNFFILLVVLKIFLWGPILKILDERKRRIEEGLNRAEQAASDALVTEEEARKVIEEARAEARAQNLRSQEAAAKLREELEEKARYEANQIIERAREEIRLEKEQIVQQLQSQFADLTIHAAERVISQSIDKSAHQRLIDEVLTESNFGQDKEN